MPSWLARHDGFEAPVNPPFHRTTITVAYLEVVRNSHTKIGHMSPESEVSEVLLALEKAARASNFHLLDLSEVFGTNKWSAVRNIENDVYPFSDDLDNEIIDADLTSRFMASAFQIDAIVSMLNVLSSSANHIQSKLKQTQERISAKLSKGINRLPDELIAAVFQFAVRDKGNEGGRQAISLSQTSRRFRNIALRTRSLWNILSSSNSTSQLETFIARAGSNEEYNIFVHFTHRMFSSGIDRFTNACRSSAPRWKTMTLTQDDKLCVSNASVNGGLIVLLRGLSLSFVKHGLRFPMLEELDIRGNTKALYIACIRENLLPFAKIMSLGEKRNTFHASSEQSDAALKDFGDQADGRLAGAQSSESSERPGNARFLTRSG
ncbi:hypothetical protein SCHPADRAFT_1001050 [Schizopora paradoxa]|uniref:F-box domain-containing protein n=1 Tax=Schizopora paradoxa TaxID=27342 RepID=A0A0H2R8W3_9AGAM|nr:hypothetical protein SCHPADRAFT_1001050 [Schizopora paradoxa]